ncbi:GH15 family glucan-1,4-alpha-glucosidase [Catalinimonas alkaloidigena]|uniref:glycoside hydrolase family 15 protein n=1 Tax=Catalinimonas alkaloidigena TaxID=1075417 RepID=UPI002406560A|nr:glycoside hydrolase family 15 protein [Catalinimonas alkaloidigena]MDF9795838.1 GH15 family glucan-1,4-alpha-glucosidase [Catalinimonas alkaloidigena]
MSKHTYDFGVIGNCAFLALVHKNTNVNWLCWPRFDSSFVFGGLLDDEKGGEFSILPSSDTYKSHQYYIENTNVLCTEIENEDGKYRVTDFAPRFFQYDRYFKPLMLVRKIEPLSGTPRVKVKCEPVGEYGGLKPSMNQASNHIKFLGLKSEIRLTTNISLTYIMEDQHFVLNDTRYLVLTYGAPLEAPVESTSEIFQQKTVNYWQHWVKSTSISDFYQQQVIRSALVLKIHQFEDTGGIIASTTTSLPEAPGSGRNWDYRYCWLRDTYYTLTAFNHIGHFEELEKYFYYIANISASQKSRYQPLYSISGSDLLVEKIMDLKGYLGNQPVRVGNQAYEHIQNDVYGQVLLSLLPLYVDHRFINDERTGSQNLVYDVLHKIEEVMYEPDAGLWEFRDLSQYHCYTYLFHWAGSSAALKIAKRLKDKKLEQKATQLKQAAVDKIEECYDPNRTVYTQAVGTKNLDASTLQLIMMNYLDGNSDKAKNHLKSLEKELKSEDGLFYRYLHMDDFGMPETTFLICAFWYVEALACVGRVDEAARTFENIMGYSNHLGLFSEDVDAATGSQWGNFPQAYSHVGLVNAAFRIATKLDAPDFLE